MDEEACIVKAGAGYPWEHAPDRAAAEARLAALREADPAAWAGASVTSYAEWRASHEARYLDVPAEEVTERQFRDAMDVLPPVPCLTEADEAFVVPEALTDGIYTQYARFGTRYLRKAVRLRDRATHLGRGDLPRAPAAAAA